MTILEVMQLPAFYIPVIVVTVGFFMWLGIRFLGKRKVQKPLTEKAISDLKREAPAEAPKADYKVIDLSRESEVIHDDKKPNETKSKKGNEKLIGEDLVVNKPGCEYPAVIRWRPKENRAPLIEFNAKISKPLGNLYFAEPSCPKSGELYFIIENEDGSFSPYDPRAAAILSEETPYAAWDAVHWDELEKIWVFKYNIMDKISSAFFWVAFGCMFILVLVKVAG